MKIKRIKAYPLLSETLCEKCRHGKTCVRQSVGLSAIGKRCRGFERKRAHVEVSNDAITFYDKDDNVVARYSDTTTFHLYEDKKVEIKG